MNPLVLVAESSAEIAHILCAHLEREGLRAIVAVDGQIAVDLYYSSQPDIVLLDLKMPRVSGFSVLTALREAGDAPVIVMSHQDDVPSKILALRIGADDYVVKPFNVHEMVGRVKAVLRRVRNVIHASVLRVNDIEIDLVSHVVIVGKRERPSKLDLTLTEFRILAYMAHFPTKAFTRAELVNACIPEGDTLERTIDGHASKLRQKLKMAGIEGFLESVRGVGYRLVQIQ
jgi:two-component system response regulator AdeR